MDNYTLDIRPIFIEDWHNIPTEKSVQPNRDVRYFCCTGKDVFISKMQHAEKSILKPLGVSDTSKTGYGIILRSKYYRSTSYRLLLLLLHVPSRTRAFIP